MIVNQRFNFKDTSIAVKSTSKTNKAVLFLHGSCMTSDNWLPQLQSEELNTNYKLIAFDLPGHGQSQWNENDASDYRTRKLSLLVKALLDEYNIENYILVGLSYGTNIIGEIEKPLPGCSGIMLVSPCIVNNEFTPSNVMTPGPFGHVIIAADPTDEDLKEYVFGNMKNRNIANNYIQSYRNTDPAYRVELGKAMMEGDWSDELKNIEKWKVPVCVVFGKDDSLLKTSYLDNYPALWNQKVVMISDASHMVNEEQPDDFNNLLSTFAAGVFK